MPLRALQIQLQASLPETVYRKCVTTSHDEEEKHNHLLLRENCPGLTEASQKLRSVMNKKLMKNQISTVQSGASCTSATAGGDVEAETLKRRDNSEPWGAWCSVFIFHSAIRCHIQWSPAQGHPEAVDNGSIVNLEAANLLQFVAAI